MRARRTPRSRRLHRLQGAFGGALVALSAAVGLLVGARGVAVVELPARVHGLLRLPPARWDGLGIAWSALATWPEQLRQAALERMAGVVVVLTLAAASVALLNTLVLLLEAGASRRREVAVRAALGAPPARLARLFLADVRRLLAMAFPVGLLLGVSMGGLLRATWPAGLAALHLPAGGGAVGMALAACAAVAALAYAGVGIATGRSRALSGILGAGDRATDEPAAAFRRRVLSALQMGVAGSVVLAALSLARAVRPPPTEAADADTTVVSVTAPVVTSGQVTSSAKRPAPAGASGTSRTGSPAALGRVWQAALADLAALPGMRAESLAAPGALVGLGVRDYATGHCGKCVRYVPTPFLNALADHYAVGPAYFELTEGRVLEGRGITAEDGPGAPRVALVNESFVRAVFDHGALGRKMRLGRDLNTWYTVVGVVADQAPVTVGRDDVPRPQVWVSALQEPPAGADVLLRGTDAAVHSAVALLSAGGFRPGPPRTLAEVRRAATRPLVWLGAAALLLGVITLLLAVHGSHAVALQVTRRRVRELAVRRALGAGDLRILLFVLLGSARNALWGGALAAMLGTFWVGLVRKTAAGVPSPGLPAYLLVAAALVGAASLASLKAAREALAVEPGQIVA